MGWSAGTFSRLFTWTTDKATTPKITSARHDTYDADIANGINACIPADGTKAMGANLPMGGFKLTGLAAGTGAGDSVRFEQIPTFGVVTDFIPAWTPDTGSLGSITSNVAKYAQYGSVVFISMYFAATLSGTSTKNKLSFTLPLALRTGCTGQILDGGANRGTWNTTPTDFSVMKIEASTATIFGGNSSFDDGVYVIAPTFFYFTN